MKRLAIEIATVLSKETQKRDNIWVLDGDLGDSYGLYDDNQQPKFKNFLQVGIAEQTLVGTAAGLATAGKFPWVFSFSSFLCHRAADQIRTCIAEPKLPVVLVGSHAGAASGANGSSHASLSDLGVLGAIGGIELWSPADLNDVHTIIDSLLTTPRPAYIRVSRETVTELALEAGQIRSNSVTGEFVILSTGFASHWASEAVEELASRGIIISWNHIAKLDDDLLRHWLQSQELIRRIIVLEDHGVVGGLADAVRRVAKSEIQIRGLCWPRHWHGESGSIDELRSAFGLDTSTIVRSIEDWYE